MGVKLATWHWTQPHTLASIISSTSLKRRSFSSKHITKLDRSALFGTNLRHSNSSHRSNHTRRASLASLDSSAFSDDEFAKQLQELVMRFQINDEESETELETKFVSDSVKDRRTFDHLERPPEWPEIENELISAHIERKLNSVEIPLSLRMIKRKKLLQEGFRAASESAYCSVKKAFSNMVLIIRELHCFTIQMRERILYEDLESILSRVQTEMHASFVWLFQQVFSHTPTLMVYVMILLANYSVYSMTAIAAPPQATPTTESVSVLENRNTYKFDPSVSSNTGKTVSVGGSGGGGGNSQPVSSGTDGSRNFHTEQMIVPEGVKEREESLSGQEMRLWDVIVDEAMKMQSESLDHETMQRFVSPISAKVEIDDYAEYLRTELFYQMGLAQDPINPLLLANYAQFLYLVAHDYDRAEEYFKRAVKVERPDAEALNKYGSFLWQVRKDLWAAEETYLGAISADPTNSYYAANYAHFLWSTGGDDTCYPVDE